jgi:GNAT superfamily N-acetyltransferase
MKLSHLAYRIARRLGVFEIIQLSLLELPPDRPPASGTTAGCRNRTGPSPTAPPRWQEKFDFGWLTAEQLITLSQQAESGLEADLAEPLRRGRYRCLAAWDRRDQQLAGYLFLAWGGIEPEHNQGRRAGSAFGIALPPKHAFLFKAYVLPRHRGGGLYRGLLEQLREPLRQAGTLGVLATTEWINSAALKSIRRAGFRSLGYCWRYGIGRHVWGHYPRQLQRLGLICQPSGQLLSSRLTLAPMLPPPQQPTPKLARQELPMGLQTPSAAVPVTAALIDLAESAQASLESPAISG